MWARPRSMKCPFALSMLALCALAILVPGAAGALGSATASERPERLDLPGANPAFYFEPTSRTGLRPVLVYLHGRGGNPQVDCMKWAHVAREFGWIICPSGPEDRGGGARDRKSTRLN